ncbi:hypothetical protein [Streptosporangium sp. NPDC087985]|uniref:hypothetical protein n=1 Tax=Streptosporangium sp. NPDC087985 TaxID=3366196 RepID=UPI003827774D
MTFNPVEVRDGWRIAGLVVRAVLLLILLSGALIVALRSTPSTRTMAEFHAAVAADRVSSVEYRAQGEELHYLCWSEGPLAWHEIRTVSTSDGMRPYTVEELRREISGIPPDRVNWMDDGRASRGIFPDWPFETYNLGGVPVVGIAWWLAFLIMLGSVPRLGNRWAWFWLFTVGQVGALVFLLLEPRPLWHRTDRRPVPRERLTGGQGCLMSIGLAFLAAFAAAGVGWLASQVLG